MNLKLQGILVGALLASCGSNAIAQSSNAQLQKRIVKLERQVKALLSNTRSISTAANALSDDLAETSQEVDEIADDVEDLQKTVAEHIFGTGTGSSWDVKTRVLGNGGIGTADCSMVFSATSATEGTVTMNPFYCIVNPSNYPAPTTVTARYIIADSLIRFFDTQDPSGAYQDTPLTANASVEGGNALEMALAGSPTIARLTKRP